jgi:hypothetical protein
VVAAATEIVEVTSVGDVEIDWAFNRWVLAQCRGRSAQRQCRSSSELGELLIEIGIPMREARELGAQLWASRPPDAKLSAAYPWEAMWKATGLPPAVAIGIALLGPLIVVAFFILLLWLLY